MNSSCFAPIAAADAKILILGSLPGTLSLERSQYYAHPRNNFWPFMQTLFGIQSGLAYEERLHRLEENGIALWDVCAEAERPGSLDSRIGETTIVANDFEAFLKAHGSIGLIAFNGAKAHQIFERRVLPGLSLAAKSISRVTLPSSSPANARMPFEGKLRVWRQALMRD
jgi:TDG/mug DNA glycosylase family protein